MSFFEVLHKPTLARLRVGCPMKTEKSLGSNCGMSMNKICSRAGASLTGAKSCNDFRLSMLSHRNSESGANDGRLSKCFNVCKLRKRNSESWDKKDRSDSCLIHHNSKYLSLPICGIKARLLLPPSFISRRRKFSSGSNAERSFNVIERSDSQMRFVSFPIDLKSLSCPSIQSSLSCVNRSSCLSESFRRVFCRPKYSKKSGR